jgi:hypothetical protein
MTVRFSASLSLGEQVARRVKILADGAALVGQVSILLAMEAVTALTSGPKEDVFIPRELTPEEKRQVTELKRTLQDYTKPDDVKDEPVKALSDLIGKKALQEFIADPETDISPEIQREIIFEMSTRIETDLSM